MLKELRKQMKLAKAMKRFYDTELCDLCKRDIATTVHMQSRGGKISEQGMDKASDKALETLCNNCKEKLEAKMLEVMQ